jgi:hypothetical protein
MARCEHCLEDGSWWSVPHQACLRADKAGELTKRRLGLLDTATQGFTRRVVVREYESNNSGTALFENEAAEMLERGYGIEQSGLDGGNLHAGRLILTGGLSVLAGRRGIRAKKKVTVTFVKGTLATFE